MARYSAGHLGPLVPTRVTRLADLALFATGVRRTAGFRRACPTFALTHAGSCDLDSTGKRQWDCEAAAAGKERSARAGAEKLDIIASEGSRCQGDVLEPTL